MKRSIALLGRVGTTFSAIGLALFLVSLIPPMTTGSYLGNGYVHKTWLTGYDGVLTSQQRLHMTVTANGSLNVYMLEVSSRTIYDWINEYYSTSIDFSDVTYFDRFLESNPTSIAWQGEIHNGAIDCEYVPTKITNVTLAISTHSSDLVSVVYSGFLLSSVAPSTKVQTLSEFAIPIGVVLTLPWVSNRLRGKRRRED